MQEGLKWRQELLSQNNRLLQSLRVELKVYEKLDAQHGIPRGTGAGPGLSRPGLCVGLSSHPGLTWMGGVFQSKLSGPLFLSGGSGARPADVWIFTALLSVALGSSSHPWGPVSSSVKRAH